MISLVKGCGDQFNNCFEVVVVVGVVVVKRSKYPDWRSRGPGFESR